MSFCASSFLKKKIKNTRPTSQVIDSQYSQRCSNQNSNMQPMAKSGFQLRRSIRVATGQIQSGRLLPQTLNPLKKSLLKSTQTRLTSSPNPRYINPYPTYLTYISANYIIFSLLIYYIYYISKLLHNLYRKQQASTCISVQIAQY